MAPNRQGYEKDIAWWLCISLKHAEHFEVSSMLNNTVLQIMSKQRD